MRKLVAIFVGISAIVACVITVSPGPITTTGTGSTGGESDSGTDESTEEGESSDVNTGTSFGETGTAEGDESMGSFTGAILDVGLDSIGTTTSEGPDTGAQDADECNDEG